MHVDADGAWAWLHPGDGAEQLRVAALEQLLEAKLALGAHAEVVGQLEALIGEHPYRERLRTQLHAGALPLRPVYLHARRVGRARTPLSQRQSPARKRGVRLRELGLGYDVDAPEGG